MKPKSYSVNGPINGICKQHAVWVNSGSVSAPLIYLQRPKWIKNDEVWNEIVKSVRIDLRVTEIK